MKVIPETRCAHYIWYLRFIRYIIIETTQKLPVLNVTVLFFRIRIQETALVLRTTAFTWVLLRKKKPIISNTGRFIFFNSTVSYTYLIKFVSDLRQLGVFSRYYGVIHL